MKRNCARPCGPTISHLVTDTVNDKSQSNVFTEDMLLHSDVTLNQTPEPKATLQLRKSGDGWYSAPSHSVGYFKGGAGCSEIRKTIRLSMPSSLLSVVRLPLSHLVGRRPSASCFWSMRLRIIPSSRWKVLCTVMRIKD